MIRRVLLGTICICMVFAGGCQSVSVVTAAESTPSPSSTPEPTPTETPEPTSAETSEPTPTPVPEPTQVTILAVGDLLCLSAQLSAANTGDGYSFDYCFSEIKEVISSADLAIANLETLVAEGFSYTGSAPVTEIIVESEDGSGPVPTTTRGNTKINAPETFLSAVADCGFDVLTNANNHIYDRGSDGIIQTVQKLDEYGIAHTGAYATEEEKTPLIVDVEGINIAILAYTDILNNRPGSDNAYMIDTYSEEQVTSDIAAAKDAGADYVIVSMHWGTEHTHNPTSTQRVMAQFIADAGADIILGSHSHCTQPMEYIETARGSVPVIYSLGNFISSMSKTMHNDGVILSIELEKEYETGSTSLVSLTYIPTLCTTTSAGRFVVLPADLASINESDMASSLEDSRERTVDILGDAVATPQ